MYMAYQQTQHTIANGYESSFVSVKFVVPQETGFPIHVLFSLLINDITTEISSQIRKTSSR